MKKIIILLAILLFFGWKANAQSPEKMSYQAVVRNNNSDLVTQQSIGIQISILKGSISGTAVYIETQNPISNANGLVSLEIGTGTIVSGDFSSINWANDLYFIKTEIDPTGGVSYTISGTSQFLSVPYALYAKTAGSTIESDPLFGASIAFGISANDTSIWNSKLDSYSETDPLFINSLANAITSGDTSNWNNKLNNFAEIDPIFSTSVAIGITSTDTSLWNSKLDGYTETDPVFSTSLANFLTATDTVYWNSKLDNYIETDPLFVASVANGITATDTAHWNNHLIDTDTQLDSASIANMGFITEKQIRRDSFYLGQDTLGGIVFYLYKDSYGNQHGLIVSKSESQAIWQAFGTSTGANRTEDGEFNTTLLVGSPARSAIQGLGQDWYLPSIDELGILYYNRFLANKALRAGGYPLLSNTANYWSSTEYSSDVAFNFRFFNGNANYSFKNASLLVRGVRAF